MKQKEGPAVSVIRERGKSVKRNRLTIWGLGVCVIWMCISCRSTAPLEMSGETQRRFDYYYLEATKQKLAARHDEAFALYKHCLEINPNAAEALYEVGLYHITLEEGEKGEEYLRRAVAKEPDNIYYKEALASYYLRKRDTKKVVPVLEDMVRCNPSRSDVLGQLVSLYMDSNNYREAINALDRIETLEGRNASISMEKFRLYRELKEESKGFEALEALAADNPNDLSYRVLIGDQYLLLQQPDKAYAIYREVLQKEPHNQAVRLSLLDYYKQTEQDTLYQRQLDSLLYGKGTEDRVRAVLMRNYIVDKENEKADSTEVLNVFNRIFAAVPENVDMLSLYASYLQLKKMGDESVANAMERILKLEPDNQAALLQLMQYAINRQDYRKVAEICRKGISHYPEQLPYYFYLGFSYYQQDQPEKALEIFQKGIKQVKSDTDASIASDMYSIMGDLLYGSGQKDSAFAAYDSCLVYKPDNMGCLNNYAYYLSLDKKELDKAEEMSYRTVRAQPNNKTFLDTYAWILFMKGRYTEAKIYIDKVVEGDTDNDEDVSAGVLEHAGDIYAKCGEMEKAMMFWKKALEKENGKNVSEWLKKKIQQKKYLEE